MVYLTIWISHPTPKPVPASKKSKEAIVIDDDSDVDVKPSRASLKYVISVSDVFVKMLIWCRGKGRKIFSLNAIAITASQYLLFLSSMTNIDVSIYKEQ